MLVLPSAPKALRCSERQNHCSPMSLSVTLLLFLKTVKSQCKLFLYCALDWQIVHDFSFRLNSLKPILVLHSSQTLCVLLDARVRRQNDASSWEHRLPANSRTKQSQGNHEYHSLSWIPENMRLEINDLLIRSPSFVSSNTWLSVAVKVFFFSPRLAWNYSDSFILVYVSWIYGNFTSRWLGRCCGWFITSHPLVLTFPVVSPSQMLPHLFRGNPARNGTFP